MLGLNRNYTPQKWISRFLFSTSATPMLLCVHQQVNKSVANADNTVPPHCSSLSAAACLFTSCCGRGIRTSRTGHELRMSFCCPISTKQSIARGEKCFIVVPPHWKSCCSICPTGKHRLRQGAGHHICGEFTTDSFSFLFGKLRFRSAQCVGFTAILCVFTAVFCPFACLLWKNRAFCLY